MTAPWSFAQWGLDIMGPFLTALRQLKFLVVGIDYFTEWVEVELLATITEKSSVRQQRIQGLLLRARY